MAEVRQHACDTRHDRRETDDGVQRGDHLRKLDSGDPATNNRSRRPAERRHCGELYENLRVEAYCSEGGEYTRPHT